MKRHGPIGWLTGRSRRFWVMAVALSPVLYVVSFGPACWLNERRWVGREVVSALYRPVISLASHNGLRGPLLWYAALGASSDDIPRIEKGTIR